MKAKKITFTLVLLMGSLMCMAETLPLADAGAPFGMLPLVDEVNCGDPDDAHPLTQFPENVSRVETILGQPCRVLPTEGDAKYFGYLLGKGKNLEAGKAYLLTVEYPEDQPRTLFIMNRGCETPLGFATGRALGDTIYTYTNNNLESLDYPLSGQYGTWQMLFHLHDRYTGIKMLRGEPTEEVQRNMTPADGFWVIIAQAKGQNYPYSAGAAASRIRLFEVPDEEAFYLPINFPQDLPRRHLFFREEMSDGVLGGGKHPSGLDNETDWYEYKARLQKVLGMNTFSKDLLEFGHNQGWDSGGGWYNEASTPMRWQKILAMLKNYDLDVLPYYEYAGGPGPEGQGTKAKVEGKVRPLGTEGPYTHITWTERFYADVTDPDTLEEAKKLLDYTIIRHKDKVPFVGAWFRVRPSHIPVSFGDDALARFAKEANDGVAITREQLQQSPELYQKYIHWWLGKRQAFFVALRDHMRENGIENAIFMFTADSSEPGLSIMDNGIVTDDVAYAKARMAAYEENRNRPVKAIDEVLAEDLYLKAVSESRQGWAQWEWQHSIPQADPQNYKETDGIILTMPINRAYTVSSEKPFDLYRLPAGLGVAYHYALNENVMTVNRDPVLGYFVCQVERNGPYSMQAEAKAVANGDPDYIAYLAAASFNRGFPQYVRNFNQAFLALPALPSQKIDASSDEEVVVRAIETDGKGTYLAIVNTGMGDKKAVTITLPREGEVINAATGEPMEAVEGKLTLDLYPCQLMAVLVK